jgi:membrane-associated phospholipid phosphatase
VGVLLAMWAFRRRRRLVAGGAVFEAWTFDRVAAGERPRLAHLGLNPLGRLLLGLNVVALIAGIALFSAASLTIEWSTVWLGAVLLGAIVVVWLNLYFVPGKRAEWFVAEVLFVTFAMVLLTNVLVPMQYGALALAAPYADPWLARADAWLGVSVPAMTAWTWAHPWASRLATVTYFTFAPQMLLTVLTLAVLRDRDRLWEFAFHFHVCLIVTIAAVAVWPSACAPVFYGFEPTIDTTRAIAQIRGFHEGSMSIVRFDDLDGLVSFPSFHVAGALLVTWAFRSRRHLFVPLIVLNIGLALSTVVTGEHYVVDVLAAVVLVAASVALYRWRGKRLLAADE